MDKSLAKSVFRNVELPVAPDLVFDADTTPAEADALIRRKLGDRVVIKPLRQGSAIGVTLIANGGDLQAGLTSALALGDGILIEPYVLGREITVGVLDLHGSEIQALPVIEIRTAPEEWYDYTNRYTQGRSEHIIPAPLGEALNDKLQAITITAHRALGLRDLSRADFIVTDSEEIVLLEVNTMPGMTPTSLFPDGARAMGIEFHELMDKLVTSAIARKR